MVTKLIQDQNSPGKYPKCPELNFEIEAEDLRQFLATKTTACMTNVEQ